MKVKVNVWQMGFDNIKAYMLRDSNGTACKERGYVLVENTDGWEEEVWNLLNWSCWTDKKPEDVHSPLEYCNSDVILQIDGTNEYKRAESVGWTDYTSLESAIDALKKTPCSLWPLKEVPREYTTYTVKNGVVMGSNDDKNWFVIE